MSSDVIEAGDLCRLFAENFAVDESSSDCSAASPHIAPAFCCSHCHSNDINALIISAAAAAIGHSDVDELELDCTLCGGLTHVNVTAVCDDVNRDEDESAVECLSCGNQLIDLFKTTLDAETKKLASVRCLLCDTLETFNSIAAEDISTPDELVHEHVMNARNRRVREKSHSNASAAVTRTAQFAANLLINGHLSTGSNVSLTSSKCELAETRSAVQLSVTTTPSMPHSLMRRRVHDLADLRPGDHVAFHRNYLVWHHAIVVAASDVTSEITMMHYNGAPKKLNGKLISVRLETEVVDANDQELYRYEYNACYEPQQVLERAASRLGEADYGPGRNCEHFARWCKTGEEKCFQVETVRHRLIATGVLTLGKQLEEGVVSVARYLCKEAPEEIFRCGTGGLSYVASIQERAVNLFSDGASHMAYGMKWGALAGNITVNFIIEAANFGVDVGHEYTWYREGKISWDDFRQQAAKTGCECLGGLLGSTSGGLLLQLLIPIPFIGGFLGCALGNILGRLIGAGIGKQLHKVKDG